MTSFEKIFHWMKSPFILFLFICLIVLSYFYVDRDVASYFYSLNSRSHLFLFNWLTVLGKWKLSAFVLLGFWLYFRYIKVNTVYELRCWYLLGCVVLSNFICLALKITLSRARPDLLFQAQQFGFYWFQFKKAYWSFPSSHTITIVSLASGLGVLFPRHFYALLCVAVVISMTRVVLYYHYLSDVMIGFYLAVLIVGYWTEIIKKRPKYKSGFLSTSQ